MSQSMLLRQMHHAVHAVLFAAALSLLAVGALRRTPQPTLDGAENWWNGKAAQQFEHHYDEAFPVRRFGVSLWAAIDYVLFDEAQAGVVPGRDGWLYSDEEFLLPPDAAVQVQRNLDAIITVQRQLSARGIALLLAPVPEKAAIYAEHLDRRQPPALHAELYDRLLAQLDAAGVARADLRGVLRQGKREGPTYFRTDTHWTPQGAAQAALVIAQAARRQLPAPRSPQRFRTITQAKRAHRGDLFNYLPLDPYFSWLLPPQEEISPQQTLAESGADLLGEAPAPRIALVGTSYSANPNWNFVGALRQVLGEDLASYAQDGRGPYQPLADYLRGTDFRRAPPRLLIWELPVRYLPVAQDAARAALPSHSS